MATLAEELDAYGESLRHLLEALDAGGTPESVLPLSERAAALFAPLRARLELCAPGERAKHAPQLAQARRWSSIVSARCEQQRAQVADRLANLHRARQALAAHPAPSPGGSCDIAG